MRGCIRWKTRLKRDNLLRLPILQNGEAFLLEIIDRAAVIIGDHDIDQNICSAGLENPVREQQRRKSLTQTSRAERRGENTRYRERKEARLHALPYGGCAND
jgi:hypothetical protein